MKRYSYILPFFAILLFAFSKQGIAQACSATWNLNTSTAPTIVGAITGSTGSAAAVGPGLTVTGTLDANYGTWGQNTWPSTSAIAVPSTETHYIQFSITPTCGTLNITSINMNTYNNEGVPNDNLDIFWSTSSTFATSTAIVTAVSMPAGAVNYTNGAIAASCIAGQTIYFRVYFHYASVGVYFGVKSMVLSGTTGACCTPPTTQATGFTSSVACGVSETIGWTRGNGNDVMVVCRAGSATTGPTSGTAYTANTIYGSGSACGGGFVVYNGTGTSVTVTGLTAGTTYYYDIYEYNTIGTCYETPSLSGNALTSTNDNWACATVLTVGAAATAGSTTGASLEANESIGCNSTASGAQHVASQSVWYKFTATATQSYAQINLTAGCYDHFGTTIWDASLVSTSNGSTYQTTNINGAYCGMISCQSMDNNTAAFNPFLFDLCHLTIGNTYYIQVVNSTLNACGSASFNILVTNANPGGTITNPCQPDGQGSNYLTSPIAECYINACATAPGCPVCATYTLNGAGGENQNNIVWNSYYSFTTTGGCSNDLEFQQCVWAGCPCNCPTGNVDWLSFQLYDATGTTCITSGDFSTSTDGYGYLGIPGVGCSTGYILQYTTEQISCTYTKFTPFTDNYGSSSCALPIELIHFTAAENAQGNVDINWATASEKNDNYYTVERSTDAQIFTKIGAMKGVGNSSHTTNYTFADTSAGESGQKTLYYRLSQTDLNGETNTFNMVEVNMSRNFSVSVYPNPSSKNFNLDYTIQTGSFMQVDLIDATGTMISSKYYVGSGGLLHQTIEPPNSGIYFLNIRVNGQVIHKKIIKL